jgi:hypothetical protein
MTKIAGSGSISQKHGSEDPDPDPPQNVMDPEHWSELSWLVVILRKQPLSYIGNLPGNSRLCTCEIESLHIIPIIYAVLRIRIHMFLGLPDPDPPVRGMDPALDPDPDPSIIMQK